MQHLAIRSAVRLWKVFFLTVFALLANPEAIPAALKVISITIFTDIDLKAYGNNGDIGSAPVGSVITPAPKVIIKDVNDQPLSNVEVIFEVTSGNGSITGGTTTTNENGIAEVGSWTLGELPGINTLTATVMSLSRPVSTKFTATGTARVPTKLVMTTQPVGGGSGALLTMQPVARITDANGNTVLTSSAGVIVTANGEGGTLGGTTTLTAVNGVASFTDLTFAGTVGTNYSLTFSSTGLSPVTSENFTVSTGSAAKIMISTQPTGGGSGSLLTMQPVARITDANGNLIENSSAEVTVTANGEGGTLGGTTTLTAVNGVASFTDLTFAGKVGRNYSLTFASAGLSPLTSGEFTISAGPATQPEFLTEPIAGASGTLLKTQPVIKITDANGNPVENTVTVTSNGTLGGTTTVTTLNGVATFTDLTLAGTVGTNYTLTFTASGLPPIVSNTITFANTPDLTALVLSGTYSGYNFSGSTYFYTSVTVQSNVSSITITPTGTGTMKVNGSSLLSGQTSKPINLIAGSPTAITVVVTEPDKSPKTYSLIVTRLPVTTMALGYRFGGGIVGYIFRAGDSGYIAGQTHGIIVTISDLNVSEAWSNITSTGIGTTGTVTGSGRANSDAIIAQNGHTASAAKKCIDYAGSGYKDWFLPGKDELDKLYELKLRNFGNFSGIYWSSSEVDAVSAWCQDFSNRVSSASQKTSLLRVRAVRIF